MGILGIILAIVGLGILIIGVFALVGAGTTASALGLGDAATTVLSGIGSFIASWWQLFAVILIIGLIAYVARRGTGSGGLGFERAAGAAEGITKGLTSEGESSSVTSGPSSDPPTTTPTGGGDTDDSTSSSDSSTNVNVQQQQQQMQQLLQAIVMNNLSQTPAGTYAPQQQQQQQMIVGGSLSPNVYNTFLQQIQMTQVNQQQMINQLMQFIMQKGYDGVSDKVLVQFMKQVMDVDIDIDMGGKGDKINVQINQLIQKINIQRFEQNIEQIVQEISITNNQFVYIESLIEILIAIEEGAFVKEGDIIIIDAKQTVEIKAEILINFLEILQIVKTWELKQMIVALIEMEQTSWEVRIEQLIVIYRKSEKGESYEPGDRWTKITKLIEQDNRLNEELKKELKDMFLLNRGSGYLDRSQLKQQHLYAIRKAMAVPQFNKLDYIVDGLIEFIVDNRINTLNSQSVEKIYNYLTTEIDTSNDTVANDIKAGGPKNLMADTSREVQTIVSDLKNELQVTDAIEQETKDMIGHLTEFEKIFEKNEQVFAAIMGVEFTNWDDPSPQQMYSTIKRLDERVGMDLTDAQQAQNLEKAVRAMHEHLETAHKELQDVESKLEQAMGLDGDAEEHVSALETQLGELEKAVGILEQFNSNQ